MNKIIYVYKPQGLTPLEVISRLKLKDEYRNEKISYAGRLDPMAEGVLSLLVGDLNKERRKFENERKTYEVEILFGISTDTYDALGIITDFSNAKKLLRHDIEKVALSFQGKMSQKYPPYSSKTVNGKPMYYWARKNKLKEIEIPTREVEIYEVKVSKFKKISAKVILERVSGEIKKINGDFRQEEIIKKWFEVLGKSKDEYVVADVIVECSSGTYMRSLAESMGQRLAIPALALHIKRLKVGKISIEDCIYV